MEFRINKFPKDKVGIANLAWSLFWLAGLSIIVMAGFWVFVDFISFSKLAIGFDWLSFATILSAFFMLIALAFFAEPGKQMRIQELRNEPSWVFYIYWSFISGPILWSFFWATYVETIRTEWYGGIWWWGLLPGLTIICLKLLNELLPLKENPFIFTRFAAGAIPKVADEFKFAPVAKNYGDAIQDMKGYVNVVAIYGSFGYGKSSFARMIVEQLEAKETLYTYISLTETNEAKDFSKLFQERWLETLSSRYPKFDITASLPFMYSILRESGQGFLSDLLQILSVLNQGLLRTRAKYFDEFYGSKPSLTTKSIGTIFANISNIHERTWIVIIDELERAQLDEIYRVVEIIERFRNEGRSGLPIKLVFMLCISEPEFRNYIDSCKDHDPRYGPLKTFFFEDEKSITKRLSIPPVDISLRQSNVDKVLREVASEQGFLKVLPDPISPHIFGNPYSRFPEDDKSALEYVVGTLAQESPRTVSRIAVATDFFYRSFRDSRGGLQTFPARFSDVVALEYIRIKYPYLIEFFNKTIGYLVERSRWSGMDSYLMKKDLEEKKMGILEWITLETGHEFKGEAEKEAARDMVGLVAHYYIDFLSYAYEYDQKINYFGTTSYPENLNDYLSALPDGTESSHRKHSLLYMGHKRGEIDFLTKLNDSDLAEYSRFVYQVGTAPQQVYRDLITELKDRLLSGRVKLEPRNVGDTPIDSFTYQLLFQVEHLIDHDKKYNEKHPSADVTLAFEVFRDVLSSSVLGIGPKFLFMSFLYKMDRGHSSSDVRLKSSFKKIVFFYKAELEQLIKEVFDQANTKYLEGKEVIYDKEENFFYVMYQNWSGSKDAVDEISKIRVLAAREVTQHPDALRLYWNRFPLEEAWTEADDVFRNFRHSWDENNSALYMPLETLILLTKESELINDPEIARKLAFWESIKDDIRVQKRQEIKDDNSTLRAEWLRGEFLKP